MLNNNQNANSELNPTTNILKATKFEGMKNHDYFFKKQTNQNYIKNVCLPVEK